MNAAKGERMSVFEITVAIPPGRDQDPMSDMTALLDTVCVNADLGFDFATGVREAFISVTDRDDATRLMDRIRRELDVRSITGSSVDLFEFER